MVKINVMFVLFVVAVSRAAIVGRSKESAPTEFRQQNAAADTSAHSEVIGTQPEQIHIAATGDVTEMLVTWNTVNQTQMSAVEYGLPGNLSQVAVGAATRFVDGGSKKRTQYIHRVKLTGLKPGMMYTYHCGSDDGWSALFTFRALQAGTKWSPRFAIFGDMGNENAQSLGRLQKETQEGMYDAILHVGDFAYDLSTNDGEVGDGFMRQIESIAGYVPYMTCPGNHENLYNFSDYKNRFTMPNYGQTKNLWYSWNVGPAHIISFSTEVYFYVYYGLHLIIEQYNWLKADLEEATKPENRAERPWIITMAHRPMYCSDNDGDDCTKSVSIIRSALEDVFYNYGVDIEFWAHEHNYERMWPVYNRKIYNGSLSEPYTNPKAPVHVTTGSAGCKERHDKFVLPEPWDGFRSADYGYTRMHILNTTHINIEQVSDDQGGKVIDEFTLIKNKHGPEAWL